MGKKTDSRSGISASKTGTREAIEYSLSSLAIYPHPWETVASHEIT